MEKGDISQLKKELIDIKKLKIDTEDIYHIPNEQEISKKKKAKNLQLLFSIILLTLTLTLLILISI